MNFHILCGLEDLDAPDSDRLRPYLAALANTLPNFESRDATPERAIATVKGAVLCMLGNWASPPDEVKFTVGRVGAWPEPTTKDQP